MSGRDHDLHLLTGAYAADAPEGVELAAFENHLAWCASCAEESRQLRETIARLGLAVAVVPPPGMREQVLAAAGRTRQLPPPARRVSALRAGRGTQCRRGLRRPASAITIIVVAAAIAVLAVLLRYALLSLYAT